MITVSYEISSRTCAEQYFSALILSDLLDPTKQWANILKDSLTYELFTKTLYSNHIVTDQRHSRGLETMGELYSNLVIDYQEFKKLKKEKTSVSSVEVWLETLPLIRVDEQYV